MRQNLDLQTDELNFLRVGEIAISLVDDTVPDSSVNCFKGSLFLHLELFLHAIDELAS